MKKEKEIEAIKNGEFRAYSIDVMRNNCLYTNNCVYNTNQHYYTILEMLENGVYIDNDTEEEYYIHEEY